MHELSIAVQLLDSVLAAAAEHGARRVDEVVVEIGAMRLVVPEALQAAWEVAAEGTIAAAATLKVVEMALAGRCRACGRTFEPTIDSFVCPACGRADVEITGGNDILLTSVTCEREEG